MKMITAICLMSLIIAGGAITGCGPTLVVYQIKDDANGKVIGWINEWDKYFEIISNVSIYSENGTLITINSIDITTKSLSHEKLKIYKNDTDSNRNNYIIEEAYRGKSEPDYTALRKSCEDKNHNILKNTETMPEYILTKGMLEKDALVVIKGMGYVNEPVQYYPSADGGKICVYKKRGYNDEYNRLLVLWWSNPKGVFVAKYSNKCILDKGKDSIQYEALKLWSELPDPDEVAPPVKSSLRPFHSETKPSE